MQGIPQWVKHNKLERKTENIYVCVCVLVCEGSMQTP